jgi:thiol-disulfide isomerase/thioredoxin
LQQNEVNAMAKTLSTMQNLGGKAPDFRLVEPLTGQERSLTDLKGKVATVIMFICNHCPFVKHINEELVKLANDYQSKDINFIAINSNDAEKYPEDAPEKMIYHAQQLNYPFPYLFDETQEVAKAYDAACTPDFFIYDDNLQLVYRGQLDDARPGNNIEVNGQDIRSALNALLVGEAPNMDNQKPSMGCNIKWKDK